MGKTLYMDIFRPADVPPEAELPMIVNIHGGGLIMGDKRFSKGFCRLLRSAGISSFRSNTG